jgi:hypothetical protein
MVTVGLYIYIDGVANRIELFDDEKISINSSVQNASDISKVYTDFSQSFTAPASDRNNKIFSHWYDNSIDGGYDARKRKKAYIELDTIPFRKGNIQLEKATIKNGVPENYTITFFGSLVSLKDTFAGKKLSELDYTPYNITYNADVAFNRVIDPTDYDVKFPLISSNRLWSDVGTTQNITTLSGAILSTELFPALRVSKVFESIATNYNITFEGNFLNDERFINSYLWLKNSNVFLAKSEELKINFNTTSTNIDVITFSGSGSKTWILNLTSSNLNINYDVVIYKDGIFRSRQTVTNSANALNTFTIVSLEALDTQNAGVYSIYIESTSPIQFNSDVKIYLSSFGLVSTIYQTFPQLTTSNLNLALYMPDIKVEDFFSSILKMFNLTCLSYEENVYNIEQIEDWYDSGNILDITQYTISDDVDISKLETFKKINFNYIKSESFMNVAYLGNAGFEYGDLKADLNSEGSEYNVQLPFENLLFNKFTGQNLQVGYSLKTDYTAYIPKPIILYNYGTLQTCNFYLKGTGSATNITTYNAFGQDTLINGINHSLNFGLEISSLLLEPINNSLYSEYYQAYLQNIYNIKSRKYNVKALLPISLLTSIKLNNRLVIRDKRYIINNMKIDLTSGEVDFELINDFRTL